MSYPGSLEDKQAVTEVCHRYALAVDTKDWAMLATCFQPKANAFFEGLDACHGYPAIEKMIIGNIEPLTSSQHLIGNALVGVEGDSATASCYLQAQHRKDGVRGGDLFTYAGRYENTFVRTPEGWRIVELKLHTMWRAGNGAVLDGDDEAQA
jgi:ketosteroid isomerase-like protein